MANEKVYERTEHGTACGNRWKYSKLAGDVCAMARGHQGPHRTTVKQEAHSFGWFDNEGIPSTGVVTIVSLKDGAAEANHAQMGGRREVREMSSSHGRHSITYRDGRKVTLVMVDRPEAAAAPVACPFYARTFSATARHIIKPDTDGKRTLCGHSVCLPEEYVNDGGALERPERWMVIGLPPCVRCERSAASRGLSATSSMKGNS